ncbi:MAG: PTS sugar transporter subunit IIA [Kiritimatiellia bacterium]
MSIREGAAQKTLNHMIQIQELIIARGQQLATQPGSRTKQLEEAIQQMIRDLPEEHRDLFTRLYNRDNLIIVPVTHGGKKLSEDSCSACNVGLPVGIVAQIRSADSVMNCSNCRRFLFYPENRARGSRPKPGAGPAPIGIARFTARRLMLPNVDADSVEELFELLSKRLKEEEFVDNPKSLKEEALKREALMSTAVNNAIAFPHVRGVEGGGLVLTLATSRKGIDFGGKARTKIFFFMVIPTATSVFYLKLLSGLAQSFQEKEPRDALLEAETPEALWKLLITATKKTIS